MEEKLKYIRMIENLITNAFETKCYSVQDENFSEMNEEDKKTQDENISRMIELEQSINKMLSPEGKKMFDELDCLQGANLAIESRYMFKRGAIEGLTTFEYMKDASNCVYFPSIKI